MTRNIRFERTDDGGYEPSTVVPALPDRIRDNAVVTVKAGGWARLRLRIHRTSAELALLSSPSRKVGDVLEQARRLEERTGLPVIVMQDFVGPVWRRDLAAADINYVDSTGWCRIELADPVLVISTSGSSTDPYRKDGATTRLVGPAVSRVLVSLLADSMPVGVRALAERSGASNGAVAKLLPTLEQAGVIERNSRGAVISVDKRALIQRWTDDYSFERSNRPVAYYLAPRGVGAIREQLRGVDGVALTGTVAGEDTLRRVDTVPVVVTTRLAMYHREPEQCAGLLDLVASDRRTANVVAARPLDRRVLEGRVGPDKVRLAPTPLVIADLASMPGREAAMADQLMDALARSDPTWAAGPA